MEERTIGQFVAAVIYKVSCDGQWDKELISIAVGGGGWSLFTHLASKIFKLGGEEKYLRHLAQAATAYREGLGGNPNVLLGAYGRRGKRFLRTKWGGRVAILPKMPY